MSTNSMRAIEDITTKLDALGVPHPPDLDKAFNANRIVQASMTAPELIEGRALDLDPDTLTDYLTSTAVRMDTRMMGSAGNVLQGRLVNEATEIMRAHIPTVIETLRKPFDAAAKEVAKATKTGIRPGMTAEEIIGLESVEAIKAWRGLGDHIATLDNIATVRITLSNLFDLPPSITHAEQAIGERVDYTACFTHPDSGIVKGWTDLQPNRHRWLQLSLATQSKLRLNHPEETEIMLFGAGESPGWIVCGGAAVVYDNERRSLHLYTNDWIPSWVEDEQITHLRDAGLVIPARADANRPTDARVLK